jgi:hypothetical protein
LRINKRFLSGLKKSFDAALATNIITTNTTIEQQQHTHTHTQIHKFRQQHIYSLITVLQIHVHTYTYIYTYTNFMCYYWSYWTVLIKQTLWHYWIKTVLLNFIYRQRHHKIIHDSGANPGFVGPQLVQGRTLVGGPRGQSPLKLCGF